MPVAGTRVVRRPADPGRFGPLDEQLDGRRPTRSGRFEPEGGYPEDCLAGQPHRFPRRRDDGDLGCRLEDSTHHLGRSVQHVLAVVDDEQGLTVAEVLYEQVVDVELSRPEPERFRHGGGDES